jgi:hypothetical protein
MTDTGDRATRGEGKPAYGAPRGSGFGAEGPHLRWIVAGSSKGYAELSKWFKS